MLSPLINCPRLSNETSSQNRKWGFSIVLAACIISVLAALDKLLQKLSICSSSSCFVDWTTTKHSLCFLFRIPKNATFNKKQQSSCQMTLQLKLCGQPSLTNPKLAWPQWSYVEVKLPFSVIINPKLFPKYNDKAALSSLYENNRSEKFELQWDTLYKFTDRKTGKGKLKKTKLPFFLLH